MALREVYVLMRILNNVEKFTHEAKRFFMLRSLELYYRSTSASQTTALGKSTQNSRDVHAVTCLKIMDKLHGNDELCCEDLVKCLKDLQVPTTSKHMIDMEMRVLHAVRFILMPKSDVQEDSDLTFRESCLFRSPEAPGPLAADVHDAIESHLICYKFLLDVYQVAKPKHINFYFIFSHHVCEELRPFHEKMVLYCRSNPVFGMMVQWHCHENFFMAPLHTSILDLSDDMAPAGQLRGLRLAMAADVCASIAAGLDALLEKAHDLLESAGTGQLSKGDILSTLCAQSVDHEPLLAAVISVLKIHSRSASACTEKLNALRCAYLSTYRIVLDDLTDEEYAAQ